jgi:hypothetical protein
MTAPDINASHLIAAGLSSLVTVLAMLPGLIHRGAKVVDAVRASMNSEISAQLKVLKDAFDAAERASAARIGGMQQLMNAVNQCTQIQTELAARLGAHESTVAAVERDMNGIGKKLAAVDARVGVLEQAQ